MFENAVLNFHYTQACRLCFEESYNNAIVTLTIPNLSSELQGIDTGMVSYDGIVYASLETRVARYCNN